MIRATILLLLVTAIGAGACARNPFRTPAEECRYRIDKGYEDLERAQMPNPSAAADIARATALLSTATVQKQFDKFPECIDKATRAGALLKAYAR